MEAARVIARINSNNNFSGNYWHLELESAAIARRAMAGQFINIKVNDNSIPLLRRPLSIHSVSSSKIRLIYEAIGQGTQGLAKRKPGEFLDVIGPLGNGFNLSKTSSKNSLNILVAGGMGVAPLVFLAERLKLSQPLVLIGAKSKNCLLCIKEFKSLGSRVELATDDGSLGFKGKVTDLLKKTLSTIDHRLSTIYACGPKAMLKAISLIAAENKIRAQLSLEEHMACGIGACLGCTVQTKLGFKRVCHDGPIFLSEELIW
ncbi:MAG: dihydroorotate dehydrogenase electron transfer subunit [Candidatus Omnitrophica bacterium]|nr:dihydroorotate dehydrogenase electron transfer subunit [Candidatus Omnitrophota bacterium]